MNIRTEKSYCRLCAGMCGTLVSIDENDRVIDVRGDKDHVMTSGYACIKGLQGPHIHHGPSRLLHPLKRMPDGQFARIPLEQALDEIAAKLSDIRRDQGPRAIALYRGTQNYFNSPASALGAAWLAALGSPCFFSSATIDQSSKYVTANRLGMWQAGLQPIESSDVLMAVGFNPLVSVQALMGFPTLNPTRRMRELKERGLKLIVIDPRRTETANWADIHLQPYPGEDVSIAAGLLHIILREGWHDAAFCAEHAVGLDALRAGVAPFTPETVAQRAGIAAEGLLAAAKLFACESKRGFVTTCTGSNMVRHSNLAHHLYEAINVVCGRYKRAGEPIPNPGVLNRRTPQRAQVVGPLRLWEKGPKSRVGEYHGFWGEMMSNTLSAEILTPGEGQIRSLFVFGGNPLAAFPDLRKTEQAFRALDLLVTVDPVMTNTARLSHYVIPPKVLYERADMTNFMETGIFPVPFAQYAPAVVPPPEGSDVADDWYVLWGIAKRMGVALELNGQALDMANAPSSEDLLKILCKDGSVSFDELAAHPGGKIFDVPGDTVQPADENAGRFALLPDELVDELAQVAHEQVEHGAYVEEGQVFSHRLSVRRLRETVNSALRDAPAVRHRVPYNPASLNPADLEKLGLGEGDAVEIVGSQGSVRAVVRADDTLRPGVVTLGHCWGGLPGDQTPYEEAGASVNLLTSADKFIEPINAMARMSGIPVNIRPADR